MENRKSQGIARRKNNKRKINFNEQIHICILHLHKLSIEFLFLFELNIFPFPSHVNMAKDAVYTRSVVSENQIFNILPIIFSKINIYS